jgi:hypothetical protein
MRHYIGVSVVLVFIAVATAQVQPRVQMPEADDPETRRQLISGAMAQLNLAKTTGDVEVTRAFIWCDNDPDRKLADAQARNLIARYAFYVASVLRIGEQETERIRRRFDVETPDGLEMISVDWKVNGDKATPKDEDFDVKLRRVNQIWRLDMTPDPAPTSVDAAVDAIAGQTKALRQITEDLKAEKYRSVAELTDQLKKTIGAGAATK